MWLTNAGGRSDQRAEALMNITLPISLVGAVAGSVLMVADAPPKFNVAPGCKAAAAINQSMDLAVSQDYQSCMNDEDSAHEQLVQSWSKYNAPEKARCVGQTEDGGMPSYVEVLECLLVTVGVDNPVPPMESATSPSPQPDFATQKPPVGVKKAKQQKNPPQKAQ
jgi:hypothetical protein